MKSKVHYSPLTWMLCPRTCIRRETLSRLLARKHNSAIPNLFDPNVLAELICKVLTGGSSRAQPGWQPHLGISPRPVPVRLESLIDFYEWVPFHSCHHNSNHLQPTEAAAACSALFLLAYNLPSSLLNNSPTTSHVAVNPRQVAATTASVCNNVNGH